MDTDATPIETFTWELRRAFRELTSAADKELEPLGIRARDRALLEFLAREPGPITLSELARRRSVSRQHIHQSLRNLADPGWVEEGPDPGDGRNVMLSLSRKGRAFWKRVQARDQAYFGRLAPYFVAGEIQTAIGALRTLRTAIREDGKP